MTEEEWLKARHHPQWVISELKGTELARTKAGRRKLRLFACGCCRAIWPHLTDPRMTHAVEVAERFAEGSVPKAELTAASRNLESLCNDPDKQFGTAAALAKGTVALHPYEAAFLMTAYVPPLAGYRGDPPEEDALQCDLLRDVFGDPFRPVAFDAAWRTSTAVALAQGMYESRDFAAMPILADALQDAGCDSDAVLTHCRDPQQVHVRGCWVVDLVLGKG